MSSGKRYIPCLSHEVNLKNIQPYSNEKLLARINDAEHAVITFLLQFLLQRKPKASDFEKIEVIESIEPDGTDVFYCDVKIGKFVFGGTKDLIESFILQKDIYAIFMPEKEYASPAGLHFVISDPFIPEFPIHQ